MKSSHGRERKLSDANGNTFKPRLMQITRLTTENPKARLMQINEANERTNKPYERDETRPDEKAQAAN